MAADQRASYQLKVIGENLYKTNGLRMEADLLDRGPAMRPNIRKLYGAMLKDMKAEEMRYREEKKKNEAEAINLEAKRDRNRAKDPYFDYAGSFCNYPSSRHRSLDPFCLTPAFLFLHRQCSAWNALYAERLFLDLQASFFPLNDLMNLEKAPLSVFLVAGIIVAVCRLCLFMVAND